MIEVTLTVKREDGEIERVACEAEWRDGALVINTDPIFKFGATQPVIVDYTTDITHSLTPKHSDSHSPMDSDSH